MEGVEDMTEYLVTLNERYTLDTKEELRSLGYEVTFESKILDHFVGAKSEKSVDDLLSSDLVGTAIEARTGALL